MKEKIILDVRTPEEYKSERIIGSIDIPLSFIETREDRVAKLLKGKEVLIICRSGRRAELAKQILAPHSEIGQMEVYPGGILEYRKEFPDQIEAGKISIKLPIMRQVQIAAWWMILVFSLLGFLVNINFFWGVLFIGGGLFHAGLSGNCMMATILWKLPFNK